MKITWKKTAVAFLALVVVVAIVFLFFGRIVKAGIEKVGPLLTKTELRVGWVMLSPVSGNAGVHNLYVGNPPGFPHDYALKVKSVRVDMRPKSVFSNVIEVDRVTIRKPEVTYESNETGNNLDRIQANVNQFSGSGGGSSTSSAQKKFVIRELVIQEAKLTWTPRLMGGKSMEFTVPEIHLKNIGAESGGATISEVVSRILRSLTSEIQGVVAKSGQQVTEGARKQVQEIGKNLKGLFKAR